MITPNVLDWLVLVVVLAISTVLDTYLNRKQDEVSSRQAWIRVAVAVGIAVVAGICIAIRFGAEAASQYFAAYPLELSLSLDNVFMFQLILLAAASAYRATLLTWAVVLAVIFRAGFLFGGTALLENFVFMELVFGGLLLFAAYKTWKGIRSHSEELIVLEDMKTYKALRKVLPFTSKWYGLKLFTTKEGGVKFTPPAVIVFCLACVDVIFAVDSVPAVLAVSRNPYVVLAAVMMAAICLKSLYFVCEALVAKYPRVKHVLVAVLVFIGVKLIVGYFGPEMPTLMSLVIVLATLASGVVWSMVERRVARQ